MQQAINKAWQYQLLTYPNPAVGSTIVQDNRILSVGAHKYAGGPHAEVEAIKTAYLALYPNSKLINLTNSHDIHDYLLVNHNKCFEDCTIYVTLEPCNHVGKTPSCAMLIKALNFKKVVIGTLDPNNEAKGGLNTLQLSNIECKVLNSKETNNLLLPFLKWHNDQFKFFKIAMRTDGSIDGGYITSKQSLRHVHHMRTLIDLLVIGGNTVRMDRPTLDTRFIENNTKNPDILIISKSTNFDKNIPLFNIQNRNVTISNNTSTINKKNFIMIEGGYNFLNYIKDDIDLLMVFISDKNPTNKIFDIQSLGFSIIYTDRSNVDKIIWLKRTSKT
jgi:diaminohydroxyphosphoribosylaminopyrimidine deaminase/5-amino-6-(5-phosphoribosylamino)uracil reductase